MNLMHGFIYVFISTYYVPCIFLSATNAEITNWVDKVFALMELAC